MVLLAVLLHTASCWGGGGTEPSGMTVPPDWIEVSAGGLFSLQAPPDAELSLTPGAEDSALGTLAVGEIRLTFDYGLYSDPLARDSKDQDYQTRDSRIDGRTARIVTVFSPQRSPASPFLIGVHFPELEETGLGPLKLTLSGFLRDEGSLPLVEKILTTIRFPSRRRD